jgi:predicted permease
LTELFHLFLNNLLPVFLIAGAGALLASITSIDTRSLSQLILYLFSPCLIFSLLIQSEVSNDQFIRIGLFSIALVIIIGGITWLIGKLLRIERSTLSSMMLATMFTNAGNYGLPVVFFAFGQTALGFASIFFVVNVSLAYTAGTVIASMSSMNIRKATINLLKLPLIYAVLLALVFMNTGWQIPVSLERATKLLGDATIPAMLVLLGIQLRSTRLHGRMMPITLATALRLLIGPILAIALLPLFGLAGTASQAITLQAGMPTAVLATVLAVEFDAEPAFATAAVFATTLLSPLTLTPLLALLGA